MKAFRHEDNVYELQHNNDTDGRAIVDRRGHVLMKIDINLTITSGDDKLLGHIASVGNDWVHKPSGTVLAEVNDYHWRNLVDAEIAAFKLLLPALSI